MTPERIERALADFRDWLANPPPAEDAAPPRERIDLHTLVGQFIALRHEVNLQTKAARASLEQNAEALQRLDSAIEELQAAPDDSANAGETRPLLKALIDIYDALALSLQQVERQKAAMRSGLDAVLQEVDIELPPDLQCAARTQPGFWRRLLATGANDSQLEQWRERFVRRVKEREAKVRAAVDYVKQSLDGLLTGYSMSLNRIDRVLPQFGLERIDCEGQRFDPETMEVVDVVTGGGRAAGEVVEEVRRGYRLNGSIFRYAQVSVAK